MARKERIRGWILPLRVCGGDRRQGASQPDSASSLQLHSAPSQHQERLRLVRLTLGTHQASAEEARQAHHLLQELHPLQTCPGQTQEEWNTEGESVRV